MCALPLDRLTIFSRKVFWGATSPLRPPAITAAHAVVPQVASGGRKPNVIRKLTSPMCRIPLLSSCCSLLLRRFGLGLSSLHYPRNIVESYSPSSPDYAYWANFAEMRAPLRITAASHPRTSASDWYPTLHSDTHPLHPQSYSAIYRLIM